MAKDFRASQIQTTQIIASGSSGTNAKIVVYPVEKQSSATPNQGIINPNKFNTGSIGTDIFLFVSGGINERNTNNSSISVFGGDVHISGALTVDGTVIVPDVNNYLFSVTDGLMEQSGSLALSGSGLFSGGLSGSHTALADGTPAFLAQGAISLSTQSNGAVVISGSAGVTDHNLLSGLSNDDHTQYLRTDGTRTLTGNQSFGGFNITNVGDLKATSLTGSLTQVAPGIPYITTIGGISIVTQSNGSLQLSGSEGITNHGELTGLSNDDHVQYVLVDGTRDFTGIVTAPGFSGSLTKLSNGDDYLKAGTAITLSTGSDGSITISATPGATLAGGGEKQIQYNIGGILTASNNFWIEPGSKVNVTGAVEASLGFTGSLTRTVAGTPAFVTINGLSISTGSFGQVTISGNPMSASIAEDINNLQNDVASGGFGLWYSITNNLTENSASIAVSGSIKAKSGITGALNVLPDNSPFIVTSDGLSVSTGSNGQITVSGQPLSGAVQSHINDTTIHFTEASIDHGSISGLSDDDHLQYIRVDGTRAFTGNQSFGNNQITNVSTITATNGTFTLVSASSITGSLTRVSAGVPFIVTTDGLSVSTGSNGQVTISGNPLSGSVASDISNNTTKLNFVSSSLFFPENIVDSSGGRTLSDQDSGKVIFMNGTSTNLVTIPQTLSDGFNVILVQSSLAQIVVQTVDTAALKYPSATFSPASAEQNSMLFVYSGSAGVFLGGDMELI